MAEIALYSGVAFVIVMVLVIWSAVKQQGSFDSVLKAIPDFSPTHTFLSFFGPHSLAVDGDGKKVALISKKSSPVVLNAADIIAVEVIRDGASIQKTNRGSQVAGAAVGGVLLGPVGILLGGLSGAKRTEDKVRRLALRIYTNNMSSPVFDVVFFESPGADPNDSNAKSAASELSQWDGRLRAIMAA